MKRARRTFFVLAGSLYLIAPGWLLADEAQRTPEVAAAGVGDGLRRSPNLYLAAVVEVVGEPECSDPNSRETCTQKVELLEVLASKGADLAPGDTLVFSNAGRIGSRYLAFLIPIDGRANVYGATSLTLGASDDDRRRFVAELQAAGLKPGA